MGCASEQMFELPSLLGGVTQTRAVFVWSEGVSETVGLCLCSLFCCGSLQWSEQHAWILFF